MSPDEQFTFRIPCPTIYPRRETWYAGAAEPVIATDVPCEGLLRPCPICRAVRFCGREGQCLDSAAPTHVVRRHFVIDDLDYGIEGGVPGWTRGERWNGWQCPRFEQAEALAIVAAQDELGARAEYDGVLDTIRIWMSDADDAEPDDYPGEWLETPEGRKRVFAIGAWAWCWDTVED